MNADYHSIKFIERITRKFNNVSINLIWTDTSPLVIKRYIKNGYVNTTIHVNINGTDYSLELNIFGIPYLIKVYPHLNEDILSMSKDIGILNQVAIEFMWNKD